ncbi:MAG: hypothetical protein VKK04_07665 [Synechococcales bacterium]|nr:hypothetical protein [Synechococcales bacterium]
MNSSPQPPHLPADAVLTPALPPTRHKPRSWQWLLLMVNLCGAAGAIAVGAFIWLMSIPPTSDCQQLTQLSPDIERLYCAQRAAESGDLPELLAGLELVGTWGEGHPLHNEAQRWLADWSASVLQIAHQKATTSEMEEAIELARRIPPISPNYDQAQAAIAQWEVDWQDAEAIYQKAQTALQAYDWRQVSQHIRELAELEYEYWRSQQVQALSQQLILEKRAQQAAADAIDRAEAGTPDALRRAVAIASDIAPETYTWAELTPQLEQWLNTLLEYGLQQWYAGNLDEAIAVGNELSSQPMVAAEANHLVQLSEARQRAMASVTPWEISVAHIWHLNQAVEMARQIPTDSRFYPQADSSIRSWQGQLQDLAQLQAAQMSAGFERIPAYRRAIEQAQQIAPGQFRRVQAQTLIAHWTREIERIEDRPLLVAANRLADKGSLDDLNAAIARASQIQSGRALYAEAQQEIGRWHRQIQTIEDRPKLNLARRLADGGNLQGAIAEASRIRSGRALYGQAQADIRRWNAQIQEMEAARQRALNPSEPAKEVEEVWSERTRFSPDSPADSPARDLPPRIQTRPALPLPTAPGLSHSPDQPAFEPDLSPTVGDDRWVPAPPPATPAPAPFPQPNFAPGQTQSSENPLPAIAPPEVLLERSPNPTVVPSPAASEQPASPSQQWPPAAPAAVDAVSPSDSEGMDATDDGLAPIQGWTPDQSAPELLNLAVEFSNGAFPLATLGALFVM